MNYDNREYDNRNRGAAFRNKNKEYDSQPDMTGKLNVEGADYWVSIWTDTDRNGQKYLSIRVRRQDEEQRRAPARQRERPVRRTGGGDFPSAPRRGADSERYRRQPPDPWDRGEDEPPSHESAPPDYNEPIDDDMPF